MLNETENKIKNPMLKYWFIFLVIGIVIIFFVLKGSIAYRSAIYWIGVIAIAFGMVGMMSKLILGNPVLRDPQVNPSTIVNNKRNMKAVLILIIVFIVDFFIISIL